MQYAYRGYSNINNHIAHISDQQNVNSFLNISALDNGTGV